MEYAMPSERYTSPDALFTLVIDSADETIGFEDYSWRIQIDHFSSFRIDPPVATTNQLIEALLDRRLVMVISRFEDSGDAIRDVWITHDPVAEKRCSDEGESLEFRYWDSIACTVA